MRVSRTARILFAIMLLAAAAFFWVNFFYQNRAPLTPPLVDEDVTPALAAATVAEPTDDATQADTQAATQAATATDEATGSVAPLVVAAGQLPAADATPDADDGTAAATLDGAPAVVATPAAAGDDGGALAPAVVAPQSTDVVSRDLVVSDLPFLISGPPSGDAVDASADDLEGGVNRPNGALRATVNPFSPILLREAQTVAADTPPATAVQPQVTTVQVPTTPTPEPAAARRPIDAPAPRPLAPPSAQAGNLPRQLPSGTLPVAPQILRSARVEPQPTAPDAELVAVSAAIREPGNSGDTPRFGTVGAPTLAASEAALTPIGPGAVSEPLDRTDRTVSGDPLVAGVSTLSRYLRDHNFTFTGSVLGPVSVGVFRSKIANAPIVISLGQTLPDTDIVLTDLRGQQAELTQDDTNQILTLDLRR